jgi:hypothetical protein
MLVHTWNVVNQTRSWRQEGKSQDLLIAWLAKDEGESEGCSVMEWIGVAEQSNITLRESGQTSLWSFSARTFD